MNIGRHCQAGHMHGTSMPSAGNDQLHDCFIAMKNEAIFICNGFNIRLRCYKL